MNDNSKPQGEPKRRLEATLPKIAEALKRNPNAWYEANKVATF
jgi:hypothetical protein